MDFMNLSVNLTKISDSSKKRVRTSKNKKKGWKKHSNVDDIEEHLEDQRLQERTGGLVSEKKDDELFFVERGIEEEKDEPSPKKKPLKLLYIERALLPDPRIKPARIKHNDVKSGKKKSLRVTLKTLSKKQEDAAKQRKLGRAIARQKRKNRYAVPKATFDLWGDKDINMPGKDADDHYLTVTKKKRRKLPEKFLDKQSELQAVPVPHPGMSYNPEYFDHQELLANALAVEKDKRKKERRINRSVAMMPKRSRIAMEDEQLREMSAGLKCAEKGSSSSEEEEDDDEDEVYFNPAVRREDKKTEKQRKKEIELKAEEKTRILDKERNLKKKDLFRLKAIKAEVNARERMLAERALRNSEKQELYKNKPKKLGKHKFVESELEIKLSDELVGSLRLVKPEGHLFDDRYKSLQRRNIIESREKAKIKRKYKKKFYEKKDHKAVTL